MQRAVIVQGLGFGDEGKGATVDFLARELSAGLVVRYCGGSQAAHNVVLPDGRRHVFSQFGAGTLAGAATYLGEQVVVNPPAMRREARHLRELTGRDPFLKLAVHPRALVTTVYHQELNRLRELARGAGRHGSCGHGIGETRHYWLRHGLDAVVAADLKDRAALAGKLELLRQRALLDLQEFVARVPAAEHGRLAVFMRPAAEVARELAAAAEPLALQDAPPPCATAIFEGAQGVLLDEWRGFHPYTTWSTVTLRHALDLAAQCGAQEMITLGVVRAYMTRHGAGPLPTAAPGLDAALADPGNPANPWQGGMRRGWLDLVLLHYAVRSAGGPLDGLVVNCLDHLAGLRPRACAAYRLPDGRTIDRLAASPVPCLASQERLTAILEDATPVYEDLSPKELLGRLGEIAPLVLTAAGPTYCDRTLLGLPKAVRPSPAAATPLTPGADPTMVTCRRLAGVTLAPGVPHDERPQRVPAGAFPGA